MSGTEIIDTNKATVIPLRFKNLDQVYKSFMPFFKNGGLFIPTSKAYVMGQEIFMIIQLPDSDEKIQTKGVVSWVTPADARGHNKQGVGVEFSDGVGIALRHRIDGLLADKADSQQPTYTL
ncbi:MAG: PilZ domain-containing protein [Arenicellales bacterium]